MKLVFLIGSGAVGKMTVGQELMKLTGLKLFHNHMTIEPVIALFGNYHGKVVNEIREIIFREFAASDQPGMIFTYMWAFDQQSDWDYIAHVKEIFAPYGTEFYYVELVAPQEIRLARNATQNRIANKPSKADVEASNERLKQEDAHYRLVSYEGEIPFDNYLRIDNSCLAPEEAARQIRDAFGL
jgi:hypothetical protein